VQIFVLAQMSIHCRDIEVNSLRYQSWFINFNTILRHLQTQVSAVLNVRLEEFITCHMFAELAVNSGFVLTSVVTTQQIFHGFPASCQVSHYCCP
jgi:hypothetical protein